MLLSLLFLSGLISTAAPLPPADLLARNTVHAQYLGIRDLPCRFMTAQCPDKCNHATKVAEFRVIENLHYEKLGEYGDAKYAEGEILTVDVHKDIEGQDASIADSIKKLKQGDQVRLELSHYYVHQDNAHYPVRPVRSISLATKERLFNKEQPSDKR